uniref:Putative deoxyribonuclease i n=1 Tax=Culex tarsalis TaxID=7177 RepID=A0A1Q3FJ98_CULTA
MQGFKDFILNNKLVLFLSVALFAFVISTISLASSNSSKKTAIEQCEASIWEATELPRCSVPVSTLPANDPVYLKVNGTALSLWNFDGPALEWDKNAGETALLCSGTGNVLEKTNQQLTKKTCSKGTVFKVAGTDADAKDLKCKEAVSGDILRTTEFCGNHRGYLFKLGFNADTSGFITYIESCMNHMTLSVLYTRHVLPGAAIKSAVAGVTGTWRKSDLFPGTVNPDTLYSQAQQLVRMTELLGAAEQAKMYVTDTQYLTKGHMTPTGDGIFHTWKHAGFFYENAVPQWKTVNEGNWKRVEELTRVIASHMNDDLVVLQGTRGVLELPHANGEAVAITLDTAGIEVPLWSWKVLKSKKLNAGIAFVTLNNPYETKLEKLLCENICQQTGWSDSQFTDYKKGFTYCCDPNMLVRFVPHAPDEALVQTVLTTSMLPTNGALTVGGWFNIIVTLVLALIVKQNVSL